MKEKNTVNKALSPEEMTILSNIGSLLDQLKQMSSGDGIVEPEEVTEAEDKPDNETTPEEDSLNGKEVKMIIKGTENTPSDGATASDDAEERMDEVLPDLTEENVSEVEKAFKLILSHLPKTVKKSQPKQTVSPVVTLLNKMVDVQKSTQDQIGEIEEALGHILNGIGITKQFEVSKPKQDDPKVINKAQNDELLSVLKSLVSDKKESEKKNDPRMSQISHVRKNLSDARVLAGLVGKPL